MQTKLSIWMARLTESAWLAVLIIVPLLFNVYSERVFEEDKLPLMRSVALLVAAALAVWAVERGRSGAQTGDQPWWKVPLVLPALTLAAAYLVATVFSVVPHISFWGAYIRRQGTYTWLGYASFFFAILLLVRDPRQVSRIITVVLLASVPASLYAFLQNQGLDPLPWGGDVTRRVSSTAGNPIFIAAYLIMVVPLTLMRVIEHFRALLGPAPARADGAATTNYLASSLLAGAYLFLFIIQVLTIIFSQSRGPLLGFMAGMAFFLLLGSLRLARPITLSLIGLILLGMAFLVTLNVPDGPLEGLKTVHPYVERLGSVLDLEGRTARVRVLIWQGATQLLADNPVRDVVGYGPEAMYVAYTPYYPSDLAQIEARNASPDRSHNETFDALIMTGVLGFVAQMWLFVTLFYYVFKWLGLVNTVRERTAFLGLLLGGGVAGALLPVALEGSFRLSGVGLPAGMILGFTAYLIGYLLRTLRGEVRLAHPHYLLLITLFSAILAHFVEIHFGIAIGVTRLYFWVYAALIVVIGAPLLWSGTTVSNTTAEEDAAESPVARRRARPTRVRAAPRRANSLFTGTLLGLSLMMGLIFIVMTFNFYNPNTQLSAKGYSIVWLFVGTWLFGALVVTAEASSEVGARQGWLTRLGVYAGITFAVWSIFVLFYAPQIEPPTLSGTVTAEQVMGAGHKIANTIGWVYGFTFLLLALTAAAFGREGGWPQVARRSPTWLLPVYGVVFALVIPVLAVLTNLNVSRADALSKQGQAYERNRQWDAAILFYETALSMQGSEDRYFLNLGRAFMERGRQGAANPSERDRYLQQAQAVLEKAQRTNPLNADHARNLASLHRVWGALSTDAGAKQDHLTKSDEYYTLASQLSPNNAAVWNDWATLKLEQGDTEAAFAKLEHSLEVDDRWVTTYVLLADLAEKTGDLDRALSVYEEALAVDPNSIPALSGRALLLANNGRVDEAIRDNQRVLEIAPNDYDANKNLAILYQQQGQIELARQAAAAALAVAPSEQERANLQLFIEQLDTGTVPAPEG